MTDIRILTAPSEDFANLGASAQKDKTYRESSYYPDSFLAPWNPDDLYQKDFTYQVYEDMLKDDQVSVATALKKDLVLASGWDIHPTGEDQEDMVKELTTALGEDPDVPLENLLKEILSAYDFGFSVSEKLFKKKDDGNITLKNIKTRHPGTWLINTDNKGNVTKYEQIGTEATASDIDPKSLIHYINNPAWQNPYGTSDLRAAYSAYFIKKQIVRYYAIFIEKAASPTPIAKYPDNLEDAAIDKLFNSIKAFQAKSAMAVPKEVDIEFLESKSNGEAFVKGINIFNMFIGRALLIPDLLGFQGSETSGGSFSLGENQMEVFFKHIAKRRVIIERVVNKEIIEPIIIYNYGFLDSYPKFKLNPVSDKTIAGYAQLWLEAIKSPFYKPSQEEMNHFRSIINFPESEIVEEIEDEPEMIEPDEVVDAVEPEDKGPDEVQVIEVDNKGNDKKYKYNPPKGDFHRKTDIKRLEKQLDSSLDYFKAVTDPIVESIFEDLYSQIARKRILENKNVGKIETINLKGTAKLKKALDTSFVDLYKKSKVIAQQELLGNNIYSEPIIGEKFLEILDAEDFNFVKDWEYNVSKKARIEMIAAVKDGRPLSSVVDMLNNEGKKEAAIALERYARTKYTEVMNKGRIAFFNESKIVQGYQYSAVMDGVTTVICRNLHGKQFKKGTEPIPPMHFNCRSVLIPITMYEQMKPDTKIGSRSIDSFIEDEKGVGFPKQ